MSEASTQTENPIQGPKNQTPQVRIEISQAEMDALLEESNVDELGPEIVQAPKPIHIKPINSTPDDSPRLFSQDEIDALFGEKSD